MEDAVGRKGRRRWTVEFLVRKREKKGLVGFENNVLKITYGCVSISKKNWEIKTFDMLLLEHAKDFLNYANVGHVSNPYWSSRNYEDFFK